MIVISICLSDIPASARTKAKNGKIYASFVIDEKKEVDAYGNTHSVAISQSKEQRTAKEPKIYVGNGKLAGYVAPPKPITNDTVYPDDSNDPLPF